jgi:hypothetical protein
MYDPIINRLHTDPGTSAPAWKRVIAGSACGVLGAFSCNPFELIKTRLQSEAAGSLRVGHQHGYTGTWNALKTVVRNEGMVTRMV